jgi:hypothetical protein
MRGADRSCICALENLQKTVDDLSGALGVTGGASEDWWPHARGDDLGWVQGFTRTLARFTRTMELEGEAGWIGNTGSGTGSCGDLPRPLQTRTRLRALRGACDTLAPLIRVQFLKPHAGTTPGERAIALTIVALDAPSPSPTPRPSWRRS